MMNTWPPLVQEQVTQALVGFIQRRYAQTAALPLPDDHRPAERFMAVERRLLAFCLAYRPQVFVALRADLLCADDGQAGPLASAMACSTERYIARRNQFVTLTADDRTRLDDLYRRFLASLAHALALVPSGDEGADRIGRLYALAMREHYGQLRAFFSSLSQRSLLERRAICAEYGPTLQLDMLGLDMACLREPILDVGCGGSAGLVEHLRDHGLDAFGLDREANDGPITVRGDWLSYDYGRALWGTILSHMAFSVHFIHQHLNAQGTPEPYVRALMRMLHGLRSGGMLAYTPGLPFVEPYLSEQGYLLTRQPLTEALAEPNLALGRYADLLGGDPLYAAHLTAP